MAVDDSVFRRSGRKVHGAGWQHDGSSPSVNKLSYGNCFVTAGIVVKLPFCTRAVCLPVLARLYLPGKKKEGHSKVDTAAAWSACSPGVPGPGGPCRGDAAYHGPALRTLPGNVTWTCRVPRNAVCVDLAPPRTGHGRPRSKGDRLGTAGDIAATTYLGHRHGHGLRPRAGPARRRDPLPVVRLLAHPRRAADLVPRRAAEVLGEAAQQAPSADCR